MFACNHQYSYTAHFSWQQCFAIKIEEAFPHHQNHSYDLHEGESSGIASVDVLHREAVTPSFIMKNYLCGNIYVHFKKGAKKRQ